MKRGAFEGYALKAKALNDAGVDLSQFSAKRSVTDTKQFLEAFVPHYWRRYAASLNRAHVELKPLNLTKAGNVPKNVLEASVSPCDDTPYDAICHLKYMANGDVNMADVHLWHEQFRVSFSVRMIGGYHLVTFVEGYDVRRDFRKLFYKDEHPEDDSAAIAAIERACNLFDRYKQMCPARNDEESAGRERMCP